MDYGKAYNEYWDKRWGESSFDDPDEIAGQIFRTCGGGRLLDVGCGMGLLVRTLLARGADARGIDVSTTAIEVARRHAPDRFTTGSLLQLPYSADSFVTVCSTDCLEHLDENDVPKALSELHRVAARFLYLRVSTRPDRDNKWHLTIHGREWWEARLFEAGFRKHPLAMEVTPFESLETGQENITLIFEKIPPEAFSGYPLQSLAAERELHMDMLRESGRRSDAHIARYKLASGYVRPNDIVLDAACGLGYGSAILWDSTLAGAVIGIDNSCSAVAYATANFTPQRTTLEMKTGDVADLWFIADSTVDCVVSFETVEHLADPGLFLSEVCRALKPGGRIILSVPNDWSDATGGDPSPFHLHVFTWNKIISLLSRHFILEQAFGQIAGGGVKLGTSRRSIAEIDCDKGPEDDAEWWIIAAMKNPVSREPYAESIYSQCEGPGIRHPHHYGELQYPWVQHALATPAFRLKTAKARNTLRGLLQKSIPPGSVDMGQLLTTKAYEILGEKQADPGDVSGVIEALEEFRDLPAGSGLSIRWKISSVYVLGLLYLAGGRINKAVSAFREVLSISFDGASPTIATKYSQACLILGRLYFSGNDIAGARDVWKKCVDNAGRVSSFDFVHLLGNKEKPLHDGLCEYSDILDMAAEAATCLRLSFPGESLRPVLLSYAELGTRRGENSKLRRFIADQADLIAVKEREFPRLKKDFDLLHEDRVRAQAVMENQAAELAKLRNDFTSLQKDRVEAQAVIEHQADQIAALQKDIEHLKKMQGNSVVKFAMKFAGQAEKEGHRGP